MERALRLFAIIAIYIGASIAWMILGSTSNNRGADRYNGMDDGIDQIWGSAIDQHAPELFVYRSSDLLSQLNDQPMIVPVRRANNADVATVKAASVVHGANPTPTDIANDEESTRNERAEQKIIRDNDLRRSNNVDYLNPIERENGTFSSDISSQLHFEPRQKGLIWFSLFELNFSSTYRYKNTQGETQFALFNFPLPRSQALFDELSFKINDQERLEESFSKNLIQTVVTLKPDEEVVFSIAYRSRGRDSWRYSPNEDSLRITNFKLQASTNFSDFNFPNDSLSPSQKEVKGSKHLLTWDIRSSLGSAPIAIEMPRLLQPGELSASLSYSAPISLLFFFVLVGLFSIRQNIPLHPINYLLCAAAMFSFHLLFSYTADRLSLPVAFSLSSIVSVGLTVSYFYRMVSVKFALREIALTQLLFLVGFSLAHFLEGYTGLSITLMAILTLAVIMHSTAKIQWTETLSKNSAH